MKKFPGIFNDVIGPVMRGPSSSHTAASWRIARVCLDILDEPLEKALVEFDENGAWAPNFREQGTVLGMDGGLLGLDITDERMKDTGLVARDRGISIEYKISSFKTNHANTVRITLWGKSKNKVQVVAVSLGGGSFEISSVNGFSVQLHGDLHVILMFSRYNHNFDEKLKTVVPAEVDMFIEQKENITKYELHSSYPFDDLVPEIEKIASVDEITVIKPIMPVIAGRETEMPFTTLDSLVEYAEKNDLDLGHMGLIYEQCISGMDAAVLQSKMSEIIQIIQKSIDTGLSGTQYTDRILQQQSHLIGKAKNAGKIKDPIMSRIIENVAAIMESKSAMELIVALPTAGSCGTVGGTFSAISENYGSSADELIKAYFAAGIVGVFFAQGPGFSAEEHGCQVECGAASCMAAAGLVQLMGGTVKQAIGAASMALQNLIGMVCDPVADRVEVPCLGKNIAAAVNAYSSAIMSVSGFDAVIPLNETIQTVSNVSKTMPTCLKCTGKGGLAITETALNIKRDMNC